MRFFFPWAYQQILMIKHVNHSRVKQQSQQCHTAPSFTRPIPTLLCETSGPTRRVSNMDYPRVCGPFCSCSLKEVAERQQLTKSKYVRRCFVTATMLWPSARVWCPSPNWAPLTAPHCSPVLLAQRKSIILTLQGKDLQRKNTSLPLILLNHTQQNLGTANTIWWHLRLIWSTGDIMLNLVNTFDEERKPWIQKKIFWKRLWHFLKLCFLTLNFSRRAHTIDFRHFVPTWYSPFVTKGEIYLRCS